jgi:hypothetical protein
MKAVMTNLGIKSEVYVSKVNAQGPKVLPFVD